MEQGAVVTDIEDGDLMFLCRGTGTNRDKVIYGVSIKQITAKVIADDDDTVPKSLYGKLLDSPTISFLKTTQGSAPGNRYIIAGVKANSIDETLLKDELKRALVTSEVANQTIMQPSDDDGLLATITNSGTSGRILDVTVQFKIMPVTPEYSDNNEHDCKVVMRVESSGIPPSVLGYSRITWKFGDTVNVRICAKDTASTGSNQIKLYVVRTNQEGTSGTSSYWPGTPSGGFVAFHTEVKGIMP